ncbi:MAG: NAD(P)H-hydrate dehydratase [Phycisphaerae bacterium]|jgi:hydroxyethylthiazole kinase-like uncharacterized protein yjeF
MSPDATPLPKLPRRPDTGHKGTFGTVLVIGGCASAPHRMIGAPALAARAAFRAGAGLVKIAAPAPIIDAVLTLCPSATGFALPVSTHGELIAHESAAVLDQAMQSADAIVVGPGLGPSPSVQALTLRCMQQPRLPVIIDADALNALAHIPDLVRDIRAACVLTPHPGEFKRLADALNITHDAQHPASRPHAASALAQRLGCICVLKGAGTIVSNGLETWECPRVNPILATAGTGDVLAGLLGALLAQRSLGGDVPPSEPDIDLIALAAARLGKPVPEQLRRTQPEPSVPAPPSFFDLIRIAVDAHAYAGEYRAQTIAPAGMLASELADTLADVLVQYRERDVD